MTRTMSRYFRFCPGRHRLVCVLVLFGCGLVGAARAQFIYTLTDLGTLNGENTLAFTIDNNGDIYGTSGNQSFTYHSGVMSVFGGSTNPFASPISGGFVYGDGSQSGTVSVSKPITGSYATNGATGQTTTFPSGTPLTLSSLGIQWGFRMDVSANGNVAGYVSINSSNPFLPVSMPAFVYSGGSFVELGTLSPTDVAFAINDAGVAVGYADNWNYGNWYQGVAPPSSVRRAFVYSGGVMKDLNQITDFAGTSFATLSEARDINDVGQIVGFGRTSSGAQRAFLLTPVGLTPVPEPATYGVFGGMALLCLGGYRMHRRRTTPTASSS
jgi:probable HAF family extracellular repeat protein